MGEGRDITNALLNFYNHLIQLNLIQTKTKKYALMYFPSANSKNKQKNVLKIISVYYKSIPINVIKSKYYISIYIIKKYSSRPTATINIFSSI